MTETSDRCEGSTSGPDFERVATVLIRVVLRQVVNDDTETRGEPDADVGVLSCIN
ncbi:MAG: hypothetical protein ACYC1I_02645 [Acidimicrobiales bacterium]